MSIEFCDDPNCLGCNSAQGRADRRNHDAFLANPELMYIVRILAMNATMRVTEGSSMQGVAEDQCQRILRGHADDDIFVQGLVNGLVVLGRDHPQIQTLIAATRQVPESEGYKGRWRAEFGKDFPTEEFQGGAVDLGGGVFAMEIDPSNLPDFLKGIFGDEEETIQ